MDNDATGTFLFGYMKETNMTAGILINGIVPSLAPESIQLQEIYSDISKARYYDQYTFKFSPLQIIKDYKLGGRLFIDFPPNFLIDSYDGKCAINTKFSFYVNCDYGNNRFFINSTNGNWFAPT